MAANVTLFSQIIGKLERNIFKKIVKEKGTDKYQKGFNSWTHLVSMVFCHMAKSMSVRDVSNGLRSATGNLNYLGIQAAPLKSSISYQNARRDHTLFRDYYLKLLACLGQQAGFKRVKFRIKSKILLLDSTTITLCLSLFDWARYKTEKGAVKIHTLLDFDSALPAYAYVTNGKVADNKAAYHVPVSKGSVVVADRYYGDFQLLDYWDSNRVFFVVRHKENIAFESVRENDLPDDRHQHILKDEIVTVKNPKYNGKRLRRVAVWNEEKGFTVELLTNNFTWTANTIGELYKSRWQVEIFFREIKQLLRIKTFIGTSENAVMIQIWTALITIPLLKYLKQIAKHPWNLSNLVAFLRLNLFVKSELQHWLDKPFEEPPETETLTSQGILPLKFE